MRKCELCERTARMYCESDQASLCWDCDEKVHDANFLVAKHCRTLLCHVCQSQTPWKASGAKLGPTVSVCNSCFATAHCRPRDGGLIRPENQTERSDASAAGGGDDVDDCDDENADDYDDDSEDDDDDDDDSEDDDDDDEEEIDVDEDDENQVVPWSGELQSPPPPPPVSCSSSSSSGSKEEVSLKRMRDFTDLYSDDEIGCSTSQIGSIATANKEANTGSMMSSFRLLKKPRITTEASEPDDDNQAESRSTAIINSLHRLQKQMITNDGGDDDASATVLAICRLSKDESRDFITTSN